MSAVVKVKQEKSKNKSVTDKKSPGFGTEAMVRGLFHSEKVRTGADLSRARI